MGCAIGCGEGRGIQAPARSRLARRACDDLRLQHPKRHIFFASLSRANGHSPANWNIPSAVCNVRFTSIRDVAQTSQMRKCRHSTMASRKVQSTLCGPLGLLCER
jgi:hypothetical protein